MNVNSFFVRNDVAIGAFEDDDIGDVEDWFVFALFHELSGNVESVH